MVDDASAQVAGEEQVALKEWAVLSDALGGGEIIAMIRKGGIREQRAGFAVRHERFLIYPTYFHEKEAELADRFRPRLAAARESQPAAGMVQIRLVAEVIAVWAVTELERLRGAAHEHGLAWAAVEARFRYRDHPLVHVVAVRASRLPVPQLIPEARRYLGCVSWVRLDAPVSLADCTAVLPADVLASRVSRLAAVLGEPVPVAG